MSGAATSWDKPSESASPPGSDSDDLRQLADQVDNDPTAVAAYDDASRRAAVTRTLASARALRHLKQEEVAQLLGTTQSVVSDLENFRIEPRLSALQRYARACGYTLWLFLDTLDGSNQSGAALLGSDIDFPLPASPGESSTGNADDSDLSQLVDDVQADRVAAAAYADARRRALIVKGLVTARHSLGLTQLQVANAIGATQSAVSDLENGRTDPRLSTLQRYARACHLVLDVMVQSDDAVGGLADIFAPTVARATEDPVLIEGMALTASIGISQVLRNLLKTDSRPGVTLRNVVSNTQLSRSVTRRTAWSLASRGWLEVLRGSGESSERLRLNTAAASFIGISIRPDHVRGILTSLDPSDYLGETTRIHLPSASPGSVVEVVSDLIGRMPDKGPEPLGVGIELSGPIDENTGTVIFAPDMEPYTEASWRHYPLEAEIQERIGMRTVVANDAAALATRELLLHGAPGGQVVIYMSESEKGIGAGLVFNGRVIGGVHGESGEIGHIRVADEPECDRCERGRRGCLEAVSSGHAIARDLNLPDLASAAATVAEGSVEASRVFRRAGTTFGRLIGDVTTLLNPAEVVIYGPNELLGRGRWNSATEFTEGLDDGIMERRFGKTDVRLILTKEWTAPLAAASVAMNDFLSRPLDYKPNMAAHQPEKTPV